jgi:hypothetical protein
VKVFFDTNVYVAEALLGEMASSSVVPEVALSRRLVGFDGEPGTRSGAIVLLAQTVVIVGQRLGILNGAAA